ncbi:hypothetical protein GLE_3334 [Lysobacter enzymogenes]|uniref:Uncharacterized protein n=1 Tax=Lysobacter enzymogenes TaxID=69 RepID=A0A0S2DKA5_LYSEN|nr:hypothetical protein [Lysobacter enzymogenes]ALN58680.1 hypothetical protein GLE_3334 [Lysobacter enzymogenes]QCW27000.1 hypothetical protein FE772_16490 [Lysobacter enzymogenes]
MIEGLWQGLTGKRMPAGSATTRWSMGIAGSGIVCPVGLSWPTAAAAIRCAIDNFAETEFVDGVGEPILGARIPPSAGAEEAGDGAEMRLTRAVRGAIAQAASSDAALTPSTTAIFVLLPDPQQRPGFPQDRLDRLYRVCLETLDAAPHPASRLYAQGACALAPALRDAWERLRTHEVRHVLLIGLDSLLNVVDIQHELRRHRLLVAGNSDGFIPGEAAAAVLLTLMQEDSDTRAVRVLGTGHQAAERTYADECPPDGRALAAAMQQALQMAGLQAHEIHQRAVDLSGESYFGDESAYAWGRVLRRYSPSGFQTLLMASCVGEIGAAHGPLMLAYLHDAHIKGHAAGENSLFQCSGTGAHRAAVVTSYR